jgi:hypothetical protein
VINEQMKILDGYMFIPRFNSTDQELAQGAYHEMRPSRRGGNGGGKSAEVEEDGPHGLMDLAEGIFVGVHGDSTGRAKIISYIRNLSISFHDKIQFEERGLFPRGHYA